MSACIDGLIAACPKVNNPEHLKAILLYTQDPEYFVKVLKEIPKKRKNAFIELLYRYKEYVDTILVAKKNLDADKEEIDVDIPCELKPIFDHLSIRTVRKNQYYSSTSPRVYRGVYSLSNK